MSEEVELMLLSDVKTLESEVRKLEKKIKLLEDRIKEKSSNPDEMLYILSCMVENHDKYNLVDESWWEAARQIVKGKE